MVNVSSKTKLELVIPATIRERVLGIIIGAARTGRMGNGIITVEPVEDFVRICDGTSGLEALGNKIFAAVETR